MALPPGQEPHPRAVVCVLLPLSSAPSSQPSTRGRGWHADKSSSNYSGTPVGNRISTNGSLDLPLGQHTPDPHHPCFPLLHYQQVLFWHWTVHSREETGPPCRIPVQTGSAFQGLKPQGVEELLQEPTAVMTWEFLCGLLHQAQHCEHQGQHLA